MRMAERLGFHMVRMRLLANFSLAQMVWCLVSRSRQRTVIVRQTHPCVSCMLDAIVRRAVECGIFVPILKTSAYSIFTFKRHPEVTF